MKAAAYLVIRQGGRWTDVIRLIQGRRITIGRASTCQIVIHSERCSRQHAEIFPVQNGDAFVVRDLNSRNGTLVDQRRIEEDHLLCEGETVEIAGCQMTFVRKIAQAFAGGSGPALEPGRSTGDQETDSGHEKPTITRRQQQSEILQSQKTSVLRGSLNDSTLGRELFRILFGLARCDSVESVAAASLQGIAEHLGQISGAVLLSRNHATEPIVDRQLEVIATHQQIDRSYHRVPEMLAETVLQSNEAVLARNIRDDAIFAAPDSRGQLSTTSTVCAPIRGSAGPVGLLHIYSSIGSGQRELAAEDLEFIVAVAESVSLALRTVQRQQILNDKLDETRRRVDQLRQQLHDQTKIVGNSAAIEGVKQSIQRVAPTQATVLVRGESGTGKELVAAAIHHLSERREAPFICLNCAALSPMLLESELFGHEKGAFTGATGRKIGKFEAADGGTLMLDEIGEMALEIQAKFLRVLEGHEFERVGGHQSLKTDVRVVAATNRDLQQAVRESRFRADLYFRLNVVEIYVPPLRQRDLDILHLAEFFLQRFSSRMARKISGFSATAKQRLLTYPWPGNVRELKNVIERAVVLSHAERIDAEDLVLSNIPVEQSQTESNARVLNESELISLERLEQRHIVNVLRATEGNKSRAANILGIERSTLDRKIKKYALSSKDWES